MWCKLISVTGRDSGREMMDEKCLHYKYVMQIMGERKEAKDTERAWGGECVCVTERKEETAREVCVFSSVCVNMSFYDDRTNDLLFHALPWETSMDLGLHWPGGGGSLVVLEAACLSLSTPPTSQTAGSSASPMGQVPLNPRWALIWRTEEGGLRGLWEL